MRVPFMNPRAITRDELMSTAALGFPYVLPEKRVGPVTDVMRGKRHESIEQELWAMVCDAEEAFAQLPDMDITVRPDGKVVLMQWQISRAAQEKLFQESIEAKVEA